MAITWNTAFGAAPVGTDSPTSGDDAIKDTREGVQERLTKGHTWVLGTGAVASAGYHLKGTARAYYSDTVPTLLPDAATALNDVWGAGRIHIYSNFDNLPMVYDGSAWKGYQRVFRTVSIQGTLATGDQVCTPIIFGRNCRIVKVRAKVKTSATGAEIHLDLNKNGSDSIFSVLGNNYMTLPVNASSANVTSFASASLNQLASTDYLALSIAQVGSTVAGEDLTIVIEGVLSV